VTACRKDDSPKKISRERHANFGLFIELIGMAIGQDAQPHVIGIVRNKQLMRGDDESDSVNVKTPAVPGRSNS
jgi:hypothetical protein